MLGSASIELTVQENGKTKADRVFRRHRSGRTGARPRRRALKHADLVFMESTYGDRDNKSLKRNADRVSRHHPDW